MPEIFLLIFIPWIIQPVMLSLLTLLSLNACDGGVLLTDM